MPALREEPTLGVRPVAEKVGGGGGGWGWDGRPNLRRHANDFG
jgi:hypothetical protein